MVWTSDAVLKAMMQLWGPSLTGPTAAFSCQKMIDHCQRMIGPASPTWACAQMGRMITHPAR